MNVIRFPTHLISTLEISEAVGWPHSELMKDARATAAEPGMPAEWFRPVNYRDENGSIQSAYNLTCSGMKMLLWNCSGSWGPQTPLPLCDARHRGDQHGWWRYLLAGTLKSSTASDGGETGGRGAEQNRTLRMLAGSPLGCTKSVLLAHGFTVETLGRMVLDRTRDGNAADRACRRAADQGELADNSDLGRQASPATASSTDVKATNSRQGV